VRLTITPAWLADAAAELAQLSDADPPVIATGRDLAYVMYTSGSTGRPKGTCIEQRSITRLVLGADYVQLGRRDVVAHASNTSFDAATFEIWGALLNGATLYGIAPDVVLSPEALARELAAGGVTTLFITTALFHQVAAVAPGMFHALDHLLFGGELLDPSAVRRVLAAGPPRRLLHVYGPTEATTFATWHLVRDADAQAAIPIGRPIANTTVRIVDRHGQLAPIGVRGELCVGGPGIARGYWNRPELTAERFIADPFEPGGRLYRTGDIAAWRSDGAIEFFGRADHQVKLRGFRIELGEVEARLLEGGELAEAVAVVRNDAGEPRLVAYVVPRAGATADVDAIRARLTAALPRYMLPGAIVALDRLPVTPNGKLDRRALPAPSSRRADLGSGYLAPDSELEQAIAQIWAEVLRVDRVGATDNFFDLGGSSLLAVRLVALIARRLDVQLALKAFVEAPTVAALASRLAAPAAPADPSDGCLVRLQAGARTPPIFFVHGGGGHALVYRELARAIDPERAMYGFSARGLDADEPPHASIEDMASHYLELARRVQPEGPYLLVGASLGGVIAYEMARRLAASGHAVPLCAMLDSPGPGAPPDGRDEDVDPADLLRFHLGAHAWLDPAPLRGRPLDDQLRRVIEAARTAGAVLPFTELAHGRRLVAVWQNSLRVLWRYTAPPWPGGEVQFYSAAEPYQGSSGHLERAWIGRCAVRVEVVPGDHMSMVVPPHAASLGARIRAYLTRTGSLS
jgi:amino acid adenylation domain-containing protein